MRGKTCNCIVNRRQINHLKFEYMGWALWAAEGSSVTTFLSRREGCILGKIVQNILGGLHEKYRIAM
jgi:hypothetical protein